MTAAITALRRLDVTTLPVALKLDAVVTAANGAAYLVAAGPLGELLGLDPALLRVVGGGLLAFAAVVWLVASAQRMSRPAPATIVALTPSGRSAASSRCSPASGRRAPPVRCGSSPRRSSSPGSPSCSSPACGGPSADGGVRALPCAP